MKTTITTIALMLSILIQAQPCTTSVSPVLQSVTCSLTTIQTVTLQATTANPQFVIKSPNGGVATLTSNPSHYKPIGTGVYNYTVVDISASCSSVGQFTVASSSQFPTFSLTSTNGYTLGCGSKSVDMVSVVNVTTSGVPSYTLLSPTSSTVVPNAPLLIQTSYNLTSGGTWTLVVRDNSTGCQSRAPFTVVSNTTAPVLVFAPHQNTLNCLTPTTSLSFTNTGLSYTWTGGSNAPVLPITTGGFYSVTAQSTINGCSSGTYAAISQNTQSPAVSLEATYTLGCVSGEALITPLNANSGYSYVWINPLGNIVSGSTLTATIVGGYTVTATNPTNGCIGTNSTTVKDCNLVGVEELSIDSQEEVKYYDLQGNQITKTFNQLIIEQVGSVRRKIIIIQ